MICSHCGSDLLARARFCDQCGTRVLPGTRGVAPSGDSAGQSFHRAGATPEDGERKLVTALIADIKDSVALVSGLTPERASRTIRSILAIMIESVVKFDGYVLQTVGDGLYASFGVPVACHDHAHRAVHAAIEMQQRLRAHERQAADGEPPVEVRVGIESGEVVLSSLDNGRDSVTITVGHTVNLAQRLQSVAPPGSITVGEQTRRLVEGYFDLKARPAAVLKGIPEPVAMYEVAGLGRLRRHSEISARRDFSPFVGRERELALLRRALDAAMAGRGQLVSIVTGPGAGKSRLLLEFGRTLPPVCKIMEGYAVSHGRRTPWLPVAGILTDYFGLLETDGPDVRRRKIVQTLDGLGADLGEVPPFLFVLLGAEDGPDDALDQMHPRVRRDRTADAIVRIFAAESARQPVVLIFEDLHWIDEQTKFLLQRLAGAIAGERILVLATYRPDYVPNWPSGPSMTEIALEPLGPESVDDLLSSLMGGDVSLLELKREIAARAGGNPFFIEEMVHTLFEDGTLRRENGVPTLARPLGALRVPVTVHGMLAERIDQASDKSKEMLRLLSVVGDRLPTELVLAVSPWTARETEDILSDLRTADFIYARPASQPGANEFDHAFKHVMTRDVAYDSMLPAQQCALHRHVADTIRSIHRDDLSGHVPTLAYHYSAADDHPMAIEYLGKAGHQAIRRSAHGEAIEHIREALRRVPLAGDGTVGPAETAGLWSTLGVSLQAANGYASDDVGAAYAQARALSLEAKDELGLAVALRGDFLFHAVRADYAGAMRAARDLVGPGGGHGPYAVEGYVSLGVANSYLGEFAAALDCFSTALALESDAASAEPLRYSGDTRINGRSFQALCLANIGKFEQPEALSLKTLALPETASRPITTVHTLGLHATILHKWRAYDSAAAYYDETIACAARHGFPYWLTFASMLKSSLAIRRGESGTALADFERGLAGLRGTGTRLGMTWYCSLHAELLAAAGRRRRCSDRDRRRPGLRRGNRRTHEPGQSAAFEGGAAARRRRARRGRTCRRGGRLFQDEPVCRPAPAGEVTGTAGGHQPGLCPGAGTAFRRRSGASGAGACLVHRRPRHARPDRRAPPDRLSRPVRGGCVSGQ